ncbi:MAG: rod shape-determining protein MreD [Clostridiales Family XIII bacterium]|jgi:rod shape-determining protein MreD|nr:rod shape-determining protein MreD [Clostridiales Family XIII bacterium]
MSVMRWYLAAPVFFAAFIIQTVLLNGFELWGHSPNLLLCVVCVFSFLYREPYGLVMGVIFGALLDVATSWYFGSQAISFVIAFLIARPFGRVFNHEWFFPQIIIAALATPVNVFLMWGMGRLAGSPVHVRFAAESLPALLIMHCVLAVILHFLFVRSVIRHGIDKKYYREILM